jgi:hypothetical protein
MLRSNPAQEPKDIIMTEIKIRMSKNYKKYIAKVVKSKREFDGGYAVMIGDW